MVWRRSLVALSALSQTDLWLVGEGKFIGIASLRPQLKKMGLQKALVTCHGQNEGSIRIIEGAGGVVRDRVVINGLTVPERRHWITL